jgi:hypothetical protein
MTRSSLPSITWKRQAYQEALFLITDGIDNSSNHTLSEGLGHQASPRCRLYGRSAQCFRRSEGQRLVRLSKSQRGRAYFPSTVEEARGYERVARDSRAIYTGLLPHQRAHDGGWRSIRIDVTHPRLPPAVKLNANYRHGYYGPGNTTIGRSAEARPLDAG